MSTPDRVEDYDIVVPMLQKLVLQLLDPSLAAVLHETVAQHKSHSVILQTGMSQAIKILGGAYKVPLVSEIIYSFIVSVSDH